jgi:hypothetical protein
MSLESALVISLKQAVTWDAAIAPEGAALALVDPAASFNALDYARRDRELAWRDLVNAAAIVEISLEISSVWNAPAIRPATQGAITSGMPYAADDLRQTSSHVVHVRSASIPFEAANVADRDLAGRDALIYEMLARACELFDQPPIEPIAAGIADTAVWSLAEGSETPAHVNPALPLNTDLFKNPDRYLAERDNQLAAYASRLVRVLQNPFEYATRLYVQVEGVGEREPDVYTLVRTPFVAGTQYLAGSEVFYKTAWYRASVLTANLPTTGDWSVIASPSVRVWVTEPALEGRNRIVYNVADRTLQWFGNANDVVHVPQLYALEIPGIFAGQVLHTLAAIPQRKDGQYWRQRAASVQTAGTLATDLVLKTDLRGDTGGLSLTDGASIPVPGQLAILLSEGTLMTGHDYRASLLVQPSGVLSVYGERDLQGVGGTLHGATFAGTNAPTSSAAGAPLNWHVALPQGAWSMTLEYTNLDGTVSSFGAQVTLTPGSPSVPGPVVILEDTVPLPFVDADGEPLANGTLVTSQPINVDATGGVQDIAVAWTYGTGQFHIRQLNFQSAVTEGRYAVSATLTDAGGALYSSGSSTLDVRGQATAFEVMPFELKAVGQLIDPTLALQCSADGTLPLKIKQAQLQELVATTPTPNATGFQPWRSECLERAEQSAQQAFAKAVAAISPLPELLNEKGWWDSHSTDAWLGLIEVFEPRLREQAAVSGSVTDGRQYQVEGNAVTYNGVTYAGGQKFYGTNIASTFTAAESSSLFQVGAFVRAGPGHVGKPGLVPDGLYFENGTISNANPVSATVPRVAILQPWMIEAGLYVAQEEFWSVDNL